MTTPEVAPQGREMSRRQSLINLFDGALANDADVTLQGPRTPEAAEMLLLWAREKGLEVIESTIDPVATSYERRRYVNYRVHLSANPLGVSSMIVILAASFLDVQ
jgi:hypothetical protein